ncbi:sensor histidine kinase [Flavobacterium sp.]
MSSWFFKRPKTIAVIVFFIMLIISGVIVYLRYEVSKENEHREMANTINIVKQNFEEVLKNSYISALTLAMTINDDGIPKDFEKVSSKLIDNNKSIDAVQLVPDGVIRYVYPYEENKLVIGFNILKDASPRAKFEAQKSISSQIMFFAGPLKLRQGGVSVIGRLPVFKNNKFWGFSAVIIKLETLLNQTGLNVGDVSKYTFQFSSQNPLTKKEEFYLPGKKDLESKYFHVVSIPDGEWKLYIILKDDSDIHTQLYTISFFGFLLSLTSGLLIYSILKKPAKMQTLLDKQTRRILEREKEFRTIFNLAPIGIAKIDTATGNFITVNAEFCKILGYTKTELLLSNFQAITHPDDLLFSVENKELLRKGTINNYNFEKRYINKLGNIVWINLYISILSKKEGLVKNHIAIIQNITNKKKAQEDLDASFELVSDQNKRLLNFSYIVSHNLRSHTSNIELISELLESSKSKEEQDEMIQLLKRVSKSLDETMRNLNEVVNIRSNINLKIESLNLYHHIENSIELFEKEIKNTGAILNNNVADEIYIDYNIAYLESILYNFISNAIRYRHPDRKPVITLCFDGQKKILSISDNGIGIDMIRNKEDLFGMYKTFNNNPDAKGIGLFLSKNQIDALGGSIETESEVGKGTTFKIYFK